MAEEAYRAVFLRVHLTGKIVLSLTTESDGNEREYAELVARSFGVPPLDVKVVRRTPTASAWATGSTRARRRARPLQSSAPAGRSAKRHGSWRVRRWEWTRPRSRP